MCDLTLHLFADAPMKKFKEISFTPSHSTFGTPSTKYFFALIKKIFLQTLVEILF